MTRFSWLALGPLLVGCLPGDNRPPPGSIFLTVEPSAATTGGISTADGWKISFERLLVGLGGVYLENGSCNSYTDAGYERLFDFVAARAPQKLSEVYGLGACSLRIGLGTPGSDAVLATGVTAADLALMRMPGTNLFGTMTGAKAFARGQASKGAVTKRFAWTFYQGYWLRDCPAQGAMGSAAPRLTDVTLQGGDALRIALLVRGEELFRANWSDAAELTFDALADADANGDQEITLEELGKVSGPLPEADAGVMFGSDGGMPTLADFIHGYLVPRMIRVGDSGACEVDLRGRGGGPGPGG